MLNAPTSPELSVFRLYLLRALFLLIALGQGSQTWPAIIHHTRPWDLWHGVGMSFLGALTALSLLGVRYPIRMLPLLIFELAWKLLWVLAIWLPLWLAHRVDSDTADSFFSIFIGVVLVPLVLPWGYVWKNYVTAPGDRWKKRGGHRESVSEHLDEIRKS
jgi:hypothetical protein